MAQILAIEPDPEKIVILRRLVSEKLNADVTVAASTDEAISSLANDPPDLILTSSLLPASEGYQLATHLRGIPALDHLPILTIPPLVEDVEEPAGLVSRFIRRQPQIRRAYDIDAVTLRIQEALEQSKADAARFGDSWRQARVLLLEDEPTQESMLQTTDLLGTLDADLRRFCLLGPQQERAQRWDHSDLPWLESIRLAWGAELRLLNMSCSGLLVESGIRMTLGNRTDFQLADCANRDCIVPGRVVRSDVSSVNNLGVKYITAAAFEKPLESIGPTGSLPHEIAQSRWSRR
jgi:CheY-like chemotaxis protein